MIGWHGVFVPAGAPKMVVDRLSNALAAIRHDAEFARILANVGIDTVGGTPGELAQAIHPILCCTGRR